MKSNLRVWLVFLDRVKIGAGRAEPLEAIDDHAAMASSRRLGRGTGGGPDGGQDGVRDAPGLR